MKNKFSLGIVLAMLLGVGFSEPAFALVLFDDAGGLGTGRSAWIASAGSYSDVDISGIAEFDALPAGTPLSLGYGQSIAFDVDAWRYQVPDSWATWSNGNTPAVFYPGTLSVAGSFGPDPVWGFGLELEPDLFEPVDISLTLNDGSVLSQSVDGASGAKFFGWTNGAVSSLTLTGQGSFAFGRMVIAQQPAGAVVPEPSTMALFGIGAIGAMVRKKPTA